MSRKEDIKDSLADSFKELRLPVFRSHWEETAKMAEKEGLTYEEFLWELTAKELSRRRTGRIERELNRSRLPLGKSLETFALDRLPAPLRRTVQTLSQGDFAGRCENVLAFGPPGSGKTHLLCAIGQHLIRHSEGWTRVFFCPCAYLVERLLGAQKRLEMEEELRKLSRYDVVIIDDLGYVQQSREEMEVLFTFLAHRYERGSVMISSNLPFSKWENIFKDPMTTAAAIDRLVHHSVILELNVSSYRLEESKKKKNQKKE